MKKFDFIELMNSITGIKNEAITLIEFLNDNKFSRIIDEISEHFNQLSNNEILIIAFAGPYNAGKSSIISALTHDETIRISAKLETDTVDLYKWNDVLLADTPGINAGKVEHDLITQEYLKKSDLIIYVITTNLFDNRIAEDFKTLVFKQENYGKMMLVVNKFNTDTGDIDIQDENQRMLEKINNKNVSLSNVLETDKLDNYYISYLDAGDALSAIREKDFEISEELYELSRFDQFIENLNRFVKEKRIIGKLSNPLLFLKNKIETIIFMLNEENQNLTSLFSTIKIKKNLIEKCKRNILIAYKQIIFNLEEQIRNLGNSLASMINIGFDKELFDAETFRIQANLERIVTKSIDSVYDVFEKEFASLNDELDDMNATFSFDEINYDTTKSNANIDLSDSNIEQINEFVGSVNGIFNGITRIAFKGSSAGKIIGSSSDASKSVLTTGVYKVGKFFGANFKPWGATNIAKNIGNVGKVGGVIFSAWGVIAPIFEKHQETKRDNEMKEARSNIRNNFYQIAKDISSDFDKNINNFINENFDIQLVKVDTEFAKLNANLNNGNKSIENLNLLVGRINNYLLDVYTNKESLN